MPDQKGPESLTLRFKHLDSKDLNIRMSLKQNYVNIFSFCINIISVYVLYKTKIEII